MLARTKAQDQARAHAASEVDSFGAVLELGGTLLDEVPPTEAEWDWRYEASNVLDEANSQFAVFLTFTEGREMLERLLARFRESRARG